MAYVHSLERTPISAQQRSSSPLNVTQAAGFDVLLTTDKNVRYQQNLAGRTIAIVVIGHPTWPIPEEHLARVIGTVNAATRGNHTEVGFPE